MNYYRIEIEVQEKSKAGQEKIPMLPILKKVSFSFLISLSLSVSLTISISAQEQPERIVSEIPAHVPIKVEIIDAGADSKQGYALVQITNVSKKPIYHLLVYALYPESFANKNGVARYHVLRRFGSQRLQDIRQRPRAEDEFLPVGKTLTFKFREAELKSVVKYMIDNGIEEKPRLMLSFRVLSFGDGTGFAQPEGKEYPAK